MPDRWHKLWREARENEVAADELQKHGRYSLSVFHALTALELAAKATRPLAVQNGDPGPQTYLAAGRYTYGDPEPRRDERGTYLDVGKYTYGVTPPVAPAPEGARKTSLAELLDVPWLDRAKLDAIRDLLDDLRAVLGDRDVYAACRYPDAWAENDPPPCERFTLQHAKRARAALGLLMRECRLRIERQGSNKGAPGERFGQEGQEGQGARGMGAGRPVALPVSGG